MDKKLSNAFQNAKYEPSLDLVENTWQKIIIRNKRITFIKISAFSFIGAASFAGLISVLKTLFSEFAQSGFSEYLGVLFSGDSRLSSYWKELMLSLAQSLPFANIVYTFVLVFALFLSLKYVSKQIIKNQLSLSFN